MTIKEQIAASGILSNPLYIKYKQYIIPAAVLIIALLISVLVTVPQFMRLFETFATIEDLTNQRQFYQEKAAELESANLASYQEDLNVALIALPVDKDIPGVTGEILTALSGSGMTLDGITFSNSPAESEKVEEFSMRVDVTGSEAALQNFLERVKVTPRIIKLTSIESSKGRNGDMSATIGFVTLYQKLPSNIGAVDAPLPELTKENSEILADIKARAGNIPTAGSTGSGRGSDGTTGPVGKLNPFAP